MKNVVVIGGGNGSAVTINALKTYRNLVSLSAVISMCDSGGSSGKLRDEMGVLPPGDLLRAILAMSPYDYDILKDIFHTKRFHGQGKLDQHNLGNIFLTLVSTFEGTMVHAFRALEESVSAIGHVHPVTLDQSDLCVSLTDGTIVMTEHSIDRPTHDRSKKIARAWLQPTPMVYEEARLAIEQADVIFIGPGSVYGSLIANFLVEGMVDALRNSKARIYIVMGNSYEASGETGPETFSEAILAIQRFLPRPVAGAICNTSHLVAAHKDSAWELFTDDTNKLTDIPVIKEDMGRSDGYIDPKKLGAILMSVV